MIPKNIALEYSCNLNIMNPQKPEICLTDFTDTIFEANCNTSNLIAKSARIGNTPGTTFLLYTGICTCFEI